MCPPFRLRRFPIRAEAFRPRTLANHDATPVQTQQWNVTRPARLWVEPSLATHHWHWESRQPCKTVVLQVPITKRYPRANGAQHCAMQQDSRFSAAERTAAASHAAPRPPPPGQVAGGGDRDKHPRTNDVATLVRNAATVNNALQERNNATRLGINTRRLLATCRKIAAAACSWP